MIESMVETLKYFCYTWFIGKVLKAAGAADDLIKAANKTANVMGDGVSLPHTGMIMVVKGEDPTMSLIVLVWGKSRGSNAGTFLKINSVIIDTNRDGQLIFN